MTDMQVWTPIATEAAIEHVRAWEAETAAWRADADVVLDAMRPWAEARALVSSLPRSITGFTAPTSDDVARLQLPDKLPGWRWAYGRQDSLVPHRGTKIGKANHAALQAISKAQPVGIVERIGGMVTADWDSTPGHFYMASDPFVYDGIVYVGWNAKAKPTIDPSVWERCPLSRYYAAAEAYAAARQEQLA